MMSIEQLYSIFQQFPSVQTDTRKIKSGDIFFGLKGDRFNGNEFARQALDLGASFVIVDEDLPFSSHRVIRVHEALQSLQQLARHHRQQFDIPIIAVTGSNGKTTTKELLHAVLSMKYKTYTTPGNLNNHIGIPLTLLQIKRDAEIAVVEMGANHQLEIAGYCQYVLPNFGIITNAGKAHLEGFGGVEGVRKGKGELFDFLRQHAGTAFVMWDYDYLRQMSRGISHVVTYGTRDATLTGVALKREPYLIVEMHTGFDLKNISTRLVGDYNLPNVLAALCVGKYFDVPEQMIQQSVENYSPSNSRSQMIEKDSNHIILDAYNANPTSMRAAIENFSKFPGDNKVLILGGMAELGSESIQEHANLIELIKKFTWNTVLLVGGDFLKVASPFLTLENNMAAKEWFGRQHYQHAYILVKGSRSMQMEKVIE